MAKIREGQLKSEIVVVQKSENHTLALSDSYKVLEFLTGSGARILTIPASISVAFPVGTWVEIRVVGANDLTIVGSGATVVLRGSSGDVNYKIVGKDGYSGFLEETVVNTWLISGSVVAA